MKLNADVEWERDHWGVKDQGLRESVFEEVFVFALPFVDFRFFGIRWRPIARRFFTLILEQSRFSSSASSPLSSRRPIRLPRQPPASRKATVIIGNPITSSEIEKVTAIKITREADIRTPSRHFSL